MGIKEHHLIDNYEFENLLVEFNPIVIFYLKISSRDQILFRASSQPDSANLFKI